MPNHETDYNDSGTQGGGQLPDPRDDEMNERLRREREEEEKKRREEEKKNK